MPSNPTSARLRPKSPLPISPRTIDVLDFDDSRNWTSLLTAALADLVSETFVETLVTAAPEFVEDAFDLLLAHTDRERVVDAAVGWIRSTTVAGYHGTRLIDADVDSIRDHGLVPLDANARRARLVRALSLHPQWNNVAHRLDSILREHGMGAKAGRREGQVHLTVSRSGLVNGFNHYLTHGSEFDQRVAQDLLGSEGKEILQRDGRARVLRLAVPGELALDATNRFFTVDERLSRGEVPNLVREFLTAWSYKLAHPDFDCATLKLDCGMVFYSTLPPSWVVDVDTLSLSNAIHSLPILDHRA